MLPLLHRDSLGSLGGPSCLGFSDPRLSSGPGCRASNTEDSPVSPTENTFCSGDHVSWHSPLDNSESRIQHMLLTEDPQMQPVQTPFGVVTFLQVRHRLDMGKSLPCRKSLGRAGGLGLGE